MGKQSLMNAQIKAGVWQGDLVGAGENTPQVQVTHLGVALEGVTCTHDGTHDVWRLTVPIPPTLINDGVQTFLVRDADGTTLAQFSIVAGEPLADDLRAEIALLRGELELLKKAFRQHCNET
ncbi:hypothetical protein MWU60_09995 [Yoonia sp. F2084L]|uniref:hypothetical protein n=1 Tax=Yoonia sp. F2084L TaxID=2926419 RepID=UPI001FF0ECC1|nr:hypothetical protein [Yoonia sp. F2084L]MCK0095897.1 hypothetical protein [Yoonia sp. F2084L]